MKLSGAMKVREATTGDFEQIWPIFHDVATAGESYGYPRDTTRDQALKNLRESSRRTFVFVEAGRILGTYCITKRGVKNV